MHRASTVKSITYVEEKREPVIQIEFATDGSEYDTIIQEYNINKKSTKFKSNSGDTISQKDIEPDITIINQPSCYGYIIKRTYDNNCIKTTFTKNGIKEATEYVYNTYIKTCYTNGSCFLHYPILIQLSNMQHTLIRNSKKDIPNFIPEQFIDCKTDKKIIDVYVPPEVKGRGNNLMFFIIIIVILIVIIIILFSCIIINLLHTEQFIPSSSTYFTTT